VRVLRIGLVGASRVAKFAVIEPAASMPGVTVAGVAARDSLRAATYAAEHGIPHVFTTYDHLIRSPEIDLVYLGTPPSQHAAGALAAIAAGKPVLVEKPFAMSVAEARTVLEAGRRAGVPVFEAMHSPHHALFKRVIELVRAGAIGSVRHVDAELSIPVPEADPFRWSAAFGGGALMDLGVYPLAWLRRLAGETFVVDSVNGDLRGDIDASFMARLTFAGEVTAEIRCSMMVAAPRARLTLDGKAGRIEVINPIVPQLGHSLRLEAGTTRQTETVPGPTTFAAQLAAVRAAVVDGAPFPFAADDFVRSMQAIESVRAAFPRTHV
jgi:predicted dehydrogenase